MLNLEYFFTIKHKKGDFISPHYHNFYEIACFNKGNGITETNNKKYNFCPGTIILYPPNTTHNELHLENASITCIGFTINDTKIANMLKESVFTIQEFPFLASFFEAMIKENNDQKYFYKMNISHYLSSLVIELLRILNESLVEDNQSQLINKIKEYINRNISKDINVDKISKHTNYSYSYCRHLFKEKEGISIKEYINNTKIKHAKILLQSSSMQIKEIAGMCGFDNVYHFSAFFKLHTEVTPSEFRKSGAKII